MSDEQVENQLIEWTIQHVKHKDLMKKNLIDYKILKDNITFEFKDRTHIYYLIPELDDKIISRLNENYTTFVSLNKKNNINFLIKNWDKLIKYPKLNFIFTNPKSNQCWILVPYFHEKISERKKLKNGLMSLYSNVN